MDPETKSFVIEQWAEYGAITLILFSRLAVRIRVQGVRRLDGDDYLSVLAFVIITVMSFAVQGVAENGHNRVPPNEAARLQIVTKTPELAESLAVGSKWFLVGWFTYPGFVWTEKLCILFLLKRLTRGLLVERLIKPMMVIFITCYLIIVLLRHAPMHWAKKIGIVVILCASVFTMIAAVMRVYFSMTGKVGAAPSFWACRECLVSCFVVNAPIFVAVFRSSFWRRTGSTYGSHFGSSGKGARAGGDRGDGSGQVPAGHTELKDRRHPKNKYRHPHEMDTWLAHDRTIVDCEAASSTERIHEPRKGDHWPDERKIHVKRDVHIRHSSSVKGVTY
ncbi:uncharacterized protein PG986_008736 [Apiospora aurea]|uniref:Integral membrane protein n=1 Tax=Apiospora aurea TaxID=335848 RepID=A0ABR1Q5N7_9PEZI